jgi:hypothetical protein
MPASLTRIQDQVTAMLNANTRTPSGAPVYSSTVGDKARSPMEIEENCLHAAIMTAKTVCETDAHPWRTPFLAINELEHGEPLPLHYGDTSVPDIYPFDSADFTLRGVRRSLEKIESYRVNTNNVYGPAHDQPVNGTASPLAGFYDIVNGIFYFTGYEAEMYLANFTRADVLDKLDEGIEPVIVRLALGLSGKEGDTSDGLFQMWYAQAQSELGLIRSGATVFQPVDNVVEQRGRSV